MISNLQTQILNKINDLPGKVGLYVKFLNSGETIGYRENEQFWAASVIKVVIACFFYDQVEKANVKQDSWITINDVNRVLGSGIAHLLDPKTKFKLSDLIVLMLTLSDNAATNELIELLNIEKIADYIDFLNLNNTTFKHKMLIPAGKGPNLTTAYDMGILLEKLYKNELPYSEIILETMNEAKDRDRIPLLLPNEIKVPHKYGSLPQAMHDVGIVYSKNPFIFVFLSDDQTDKRRTNNALSECAKLCFDFSQN